MADPTDITTPSDSDKVKLGASEIRAIKALGHSKVGTVTPDVQLPALAGNGSKYVIVAPGEAGLMFATPPAASGSAGDLQSQLLSTTDPNKAAGQVAFNPALVYPGGTVGDELRQLMTGSQYSLTDNNMLYNGECEIIDYPDSYPAALYGTTRLTYGWSYGITGNASGNVSISSYTSAPYPGLNSADPNSALPRSYLAIGVTTAVPAAMTGVARVAAKLNWKAGFDRVSAPYGNHPVATVVSFRYRTNHAGDYGVSLAVKDLSVPPPYFTARYVHAVTLVGDGQWHTASFAVSAAIFPSTIPSTPRMQLQFEFVGTATNISAAPDTWVASLAASPGTFTRTAGCQTTFLQTAGNYLHIAEAKVEAAPTGIPTPFAYRSHWIIRQDCEASQTAIRRVNSFGYFAGTTIYATLEQPVGLPTALVAPIAISDDSNLTSPFSMKVVGPNGTPTTISGWTPAGPGGSRQLFTATITSGVLGATNGNWQLAYDSSPLTWLTDNSGSSGDNNPV